MKMPEVKPQQKQERWLCSKRHSYSLADYLVGISDIKKTADVTGYLLLRV